MLRLTTRLTAATIACAGTIALAQGPRPPRVDESVRGVAERDLTVDEQVRHVLDRLAFGARPGDVARVHAMGVDRWIADQLAPERIDDSRLERSLSHFPVVSRSAGELMRDYPRPAELLVRQRLRGDSVLSGRDSLAVREAARRSRELASQLSAARVARAVGTERQLQEVLTDFWLNHFSVYIGKGQLRYYLPEYEREAIRPHVLGRFGDLLTAVAKSPAMLYYLDNAQSVADSTRPTLATRRDQRRRRLVQAALARRAEQMGEAQRQQLEALQARRPRGLNENYARELLELHTLGVDGGYSQQDVIEVARALTGWSVRPARAGEPSFVFNRAAHDAGEKVVLGTRLPAGRGIEDGEAVLDLLAHHPATARFIARKLAVRFVSDSPPPALVERAARTFTTTDGDLRAVVRTIVTSDEFFSRAAYRAKVKSPFEVVVSAARALGAEPDTTVVSALAVARLGQPVYGHQAPDGWPETGAAWMNTGAILQRINFGLAVAANRLPGARARGWGAYAGLQHAPRERQVAGVIDALLGGHASAETREILTSGENPLLARAAADAAADSSAVTPSTSGPATARMRGPRVAGLDQVIGLALGSPEFQRR